MRGWLLAGVAVCAALLLIGRTVTTLVVDHAWYASMGAVSMFWEQTVDSLLLRGTAWIAGSVFAYLNLYAVRRTIRAVALPSRVANIELTAMLPARGLQSITILLAILIGFALSVPFTDWTSVALARHGVPFGEIEGVLDRDLGFYVFALPLEETVYVWSLTALVAVLAVVLMLYTLTRSLRMDGRRIVASNHVRRHLSVLGALVLMLLAWSYRLDTFDLLQHGSGTDGLFLSIDHKVSLQADRVLMYICGIASLIFLRAAWLGQVRLAFGTLSVVLVAAIGGRHLLPIALNAGTALGDPARRDVPYLATRTFFSRRAYDVDAVQYVGVDKAVPVRPRLSMSELASTASLWDASDLRRMRFGSRASDVLVASPGWAFSLQGQALAILVRHDASDPGWWAVSRVDVTVPVLDARMADADIRSILDSPIPGSEEIDEPMVAPGLVGHRLVASSDLAIGTSLRTLGMRVAHAWATRDPDVLRADSGVGTPARLVSHRDVRERLARLVPLFAQGATIVPLLSDGTVIWAVSLYSASARYPLSQRWVIAGEEWSYFRFAATALVDATTGRVQLVPGGRPDPIATVWLKPVQALVVKASALPVSLARQLPPAVDAATAQAMTFGRYGSRRDPAARLFIADSTLLGEGPPGFQLPGADGAVPAWAVPMVSEGDHLAGTLTAVGGTSRVVIWDSVAGPRSLWAVQKARMQAALDSSVGAVDRARRGPPPVATRVQVLPTVDGPVLIQSLVGTAGNGAPFISRVAVLEGARLYLGTTIANAMGEPSGQLLAAGESLGTGATVSGGSPESSVVRDQRVARLYETMREALRRGDWTRFGAAFDSLGIVLGKPPR